MAILTKDSFDQMGGPVLRREIAKNSIVVTVGDSVKLAAGVLALGTAGASVYGHVAGITTLDGLGFNTDGTAGAALGSFLGTFTMPSDNQTVAKNKLQCNVSKLTLYTAEVDATIGSTTGSNLAGYFMDLVDEDTLDESTAATTAAQYATHGLDISDSTQAIVNIFESSVFGPLSA